MIQKNNILMIGDHVIGQSGFDKAVVVKYSDIPTVQMATNTPINWSKRRDFLNGTYISRMKR